MAGAFRIAEGYVEVTADQSGYDTAMDRLKSAKHVVKVGVELDDKTALAQLAKLTKSRSLKVGIDLTGMAAFAQLTEKTRDRTAKIKIDLDSATALTRLTELTRERTVKVRVDLDQTALASLTDSTRTVDILAQINEAAYQRAVKKLDKLTADRNMIIRPSVDTRVAADEIRNLVRRQRVRIGIDVDTRVAADDLANLTRTRTARVNADARTGEARIQLDRLARDRHMNIDVSAGGGGLSSLAGAGGGMGMLSGRIAQIAAAVVGALPVLASLGSSLIQMGPAAAIAAPAVLGLASAFAAVKLGMSGISDAFKAAFAPAAKGASAALSATKAVESAQRSLAKAVQAEKDAEVNAAAARVAAARAVGDAQRNLKTTVRDVADANHQAAESVAQAERDLTSAQKAAKQAQLDLTQARKDAAQQLQDLSNQLIDSQLSERQDVLNLADAEAQLAKDKAAGAAVSAEQLAKDQLARDQAAQALTEQQTQTQRLTDQNAAAAKAGVEGSSQVTAAKQGVADANQTLADKEQALADQQAAAQRQQVDGIQKIAKAQRDLADAQAAQVKAAKDGARQIADAQQAVADAARAVAEAQQSAALKTGGLSQALARLSPNARAFVAAVIAQREAWRGLKLDVQDRLFQGMAGTFSRLSTTVLPSLRTGLTGTAGVLNTMARNAANAVTQLAKTGTLKSMFAGVNAGLAPLSRIPGQFLTGLVQLSVAAAPAFKRLTTAVGGVADAIGRKLGSAFKSGAMTDAINAAVGIAKQFGRLLLDIAGTVGNVLKTAAGAGGDALGALGSVFKELRRITAMPEVQKALTSIFTAINTVGKLLAGTIGTVLIQLVKGLAPIADAITRVLSSLGNAGPLIGGLLLAFNPLLGILVLLAPVLGQLAKPLVALVAAAGPLLNMLGTFAGDLMTALAPVLGALIDVLSGVLTAIAPIFAKVAPLILSVVKSIAGPLAQVVKALIPAIGPLISMLIGMDLAMLPLLPSILKLLPPIAQLAAALIGLAVQVLAPLMPVITGLAAALAGVLTGALLVLVPVLTTVIGWITDFVTAITSAVDWVVSKFQGLYDTLVGHSIIPDLVTAIIAWFTQLWTRAKQIFTGLVRDVTALFTSLWNGLRALWGSFWSGLSSAINSARAWMSNAFNGLRNSISGTWSSLWNGVRSAFTSVIGAVTSKIGDFASGTRRAFSSLRDALGTIWNGVRDKFAAPIRFVISSVYNNGIRAMWDTIASKVGLPQLPGIKLGFARGGIVPGTGRGDTVPAMLTPGERILSLAQVGRLGGHRGIDAILGQDRPTGTGGNPTQAQERKRQQPLPAFGLGGIIGGIGGTVKDIGGAVSGAVTGAVSWVNDIVVGGLQAAARKAITAIVQPLINRIPAGGVGDLMKGVSEKALGGILGWLGKQDAGAVGGPGVQRGLSWARTQAGLPYQWAGNGNPSWDCSGLMSAIESVIRGESPHRRWATGAFSGSTAPAGWVRNLVSPFMIGITNAGVGHTAGTIGGVNVESRGGAGVLVGPKARGYNDGLFTDRYGLKPATKFDTGGILPPGATMAVNRTGRPERVLTADQTAMVDRLLTTVGSSGPAVTVNLSVHSMTVPSRAEQRRFATEMAEETKEALRRLENSRKR